MDSPTEPAATPAAQPRSPKPDDDHRSVVLDREVLRRLQEGDRRTFQTLLRPLLPALLGLARRLTGDPHWAEDLVQETLYRACRGIHGFRGDASLRTWLFQIQVRLAGQTRRWQGRAPMADLGSVQIPDLMVGEPDRDSRERELAERLDEAMERLTTKQRTALHLRAVEGLDYRAIAEVLGGSTAAARMLVLAARRHIMRRMGRHLTP